MKSFIIIPVCLHAFMPSRLLTILTATLLIATGGCDKAADQPWSTRDQDVPVQRGTPPFRDIGLSDPAPVSGLRSGTLSTYPDAEMREQSKRLLMLAVDHPDPQLRANAIEGLQFMPDVIEDVVRKAMVDENRGVRFAAAMTVGDLQLSGIAHLLEPLLQDESRSVRAAAIYGMMKNQLAVDPTPLAELIQFDEPEVRGNAALVLGKLGDPSAIPMINSALGYGMTRANPARVRLVELQMAEAMVMLGDERHLTVIHAALFAPVEHGELTALACLICGNLGDARVMSNLQQIAQQGGEHRRPAEIRMAAALAIAQINPAAAPIHVPLEYARHESPTLRAQAAATLGYVPDPQSTSMLAHMLHDRSPIVQVAAAAAILRLGSGEAPAAW